MNTQHTPTPWRWTNQDGQVRLVSANNQTVLSIGDNKRLIPMLQDRDYMEHAVNSHDELVNVCKEAARFIDKNRSKFDKPYIAIVDQLYAILAKVKGGYCE